MRTVGYLVNGKSAKSAEQADKPKGGGRPTKAELLKELAVLGVEADPATTNDKLAAMLAEAKSAEQAEEAEGE
ncbi:MAG: hypothetical protein IJ111_05800 [Eggerthellaceae bacterium]|nr:hypothetical protein [Eggerthellaceae bacterium]